MGIINATPDSFWAESRYNYAVLEAGPDIVDIGAVSTRPGSDPVSEEEEWNRLEPVLKQVSGRFPISIDTWRSGIVRRAYDLIGPFTVNDISAGEDDEMMLSTVGKLGLPYIAMHKRGTPRTMDSLCQYGDVVADIIDYFRSFAARAADNGISDWILDPGFGFGKTLDHNYELMAHLQDFHELEMPLLVGISRKSMIYRLLGGSPLEALNGTTALNMIALMKGAHILRVHDVKEAVETVSIFEKINPTL